jgi:hypothetical protein
LALLAALALNALWSWRRLAALALFGLLLLELWPRPSALTPVPEPINTASMTPPVIFLPYVDGRTTAAYAETAAWMAATIQAEPLALVNGYSGYFPRQNDRLKTLLADFPTTDGLLTLQALGVQIIVIRQDWPSPEQTARLTDFVSAGELDRIGTEQGLLLLRLNQAHLSQ